MSIREAVKVVRLKPGEGSSLEAVQTACANFSTFIPSAGRPDTGSLSLRHAVRDGDKLHTYLRRVVRETARLTPTTARGRVPF